MTYFLVLFYVFGSGVSSVVIPLPYPTLAACTFAGQAHDTIWIEPRCVRAP